MDEHTLSPGVLTHIKTAFEKSKGNRLTDQGLEAFIKTTVDAETSSARPIQQDTSHPISQYFISSSHNTYLTGNQLWSKSSTDTYRNVLERGCRCIEVDVWDGDSGRSSAQESSSGEEAAPGEASDGKPSKPKSDNDIKRLTSLVKTRLKGLHSSESSHSHRSVDQTPEQTPKVDEENAMPVPWRTASGRSEPRVLHGYTATKEVSFRDVCQTVQRYAFATSDLPLIVSLEVHASHEQQELMVEIMKDYWKHYLVEIPNDFSDDTPLPSLESLKKKILVKVKYSPPERKIPGPGLARSRALSQDSADSSDADETPLSKKKKSKILDTLSNMGVFTRSCHFTSMDQAEAQIPTHIFALSEGKLLSIQEEHGHRIFEHNLKYLMRAYPKGTRVRSSNLDPCPFWAQGIQMVALNWQQMNAATMLNEAMFEGSNGWVLKPRSYRTVGNEPRPSIKGGRLDLSLRILAAQNLDSGARSAPNVFVKGQLHAERRIPAGGKQTNKEWKRRSSTKRNHHPDFSESMDFVGIEDVVIDLSFLRYVRHILYSLRRLRIGLVRYRPIMCVRCDVELHYPDFRDIQCRWWHWNRGNTRVPMQVRCVATPADPATGHVDVSCYRFPVIPQRR